MWCSYLDVGWVVSSVPETITGVYYLIQWETQQLRRNDIQPNVAMCRYYKVLRFKGPNNIQDETYRKYGEKT